VARDYLLGIHKVTDQQTHFFSYVVWDLLCMMMVIWHRTLLSNKGVWDVDETMISDAVVALHERHVRCRSNSAVVSLACTSTRNGLMCCITV